jgi:hypothetical protein
MNQTTQVALTIEEIDYAYTCWKQYYSKAYRDFMDYLPIVMRSKKLTGRVDI